MKTSVNQNNNLENSCSISSNCISINLNKNNVEIKTTESEMVLIINGKDDKNGY